jgi:hypothetical protein
LGFIAKIEGDGCRDLMKKDEEVLEWQLREKCASAQLQQAEMALLRIEGRFPEAVQHDPSHILALLPTLRDWLQSLKRVFSIVS